MIALGIFGTAAVIIGTVAAVREVVTDGYRQVPTRRYPSQFDLR